MVGVAVRSDYECTETNCEPLETENNKRKTQPQSEVQIQTDCCKHENAFCLPRNLDLAFDVPWLKVCVGVKLVVVEHQWNRERVCRCGCGRGRCGLICGRGSCMRSSATGETADMKRWTAQ